MSDYYQGKTAVITGGASGVGRSIAFGIGRAGGNIVIGDVDANAMEAVAADLSAEGIAHRVERCDVTSTESLQGLLDAALETFGKVDLAFATLESALAKPAHSGAIPRRTGNGALTSICGAL